MHHRVLSRAGRFRRNQTGIGDRCNRRIIAFPFRFSVCSQNRHLFRIPDDFSDGCRRNFRRRSHYFKRVFFSIDRRRKGRRARRQGADHPFIYLYDFRSRGFPLYLGKRIVQFQRHGMFNSHRHIRKSIHRNIERAFFPLGG